MMQARPLFQFALEALGRRLRQALRVKNLGDRSPRRTAGPEEGGAAGRVVDQELQAVTVGQCVADQRLARAWDSGAMHGNAHGHTDNRAMLR